MDWQVLHIKYAHVLYTNIYIHTVYILGFHGRKNTEQKEKKKIHKNFSLETQSLFINLEEGRGLA